MERGGEGDQSSDEEEGGVQAAAQNTQQNELEDGEKVAAPAANPLSTPTEAQRERGTLSNGAQENCEEAGVSMSRDLMLKSQAGAFDPENYDKSASPSSLLGTCDPSISNSSSTSCSFSHHDMVLSCSSSSSHSSGLSLSPPLPSTVELSAVLTDTRLTLDVYPGGAGALPLLWGSIPAELRGIQYLRLGSEDRSGLDGALNVLSNLTELRSLAIRGHRLYDSKGTPLPGLLTTLPSSVSSLTHLVHLDLSFNQLSCLPPCLLSLPLLSSLLLCHNFISALPPEICQLSSLTYLSLLGNMLESLPPSLSQLKTLQELDVSHNLLQKLPEETGGLSELVKLDLSHNKLKQLPESMGSLCSLRELVIYSNHLRMVPSCLNKLPQLKIDARDNPLGKPPTPPPLPPTLGRSVTEMPELHLGFNQHSFWVTPAGCHVFLPGGAELVFPCRCLLTTTRLSWAEKRPNRKWVWLEEHDLLLSRPLELRPHGVEFLKPVEVCVPYHRRKRREVVVRRFDGELWSTLAADVRRGSQNNCCHPGGHPVRLACCSVRSFSWFMAVGRPVLDTCSVTPAETLLVSSADPGIKLHFPPDSTAQTRSVTLQVLQVSESTVQTLCGDPQARVSPLLCLSQNPCLHFLQPVKVQIPLPSGLTGHTMDLSCLHLLHGDPAAQTWTDITSQVSLYVTHLYAIFYITHFSWYWLWYTTQRCVSGVVRKVYQRLKQFKVQFLVLQRRTDPSQVLLQCLPTNKVESRVKFLSEQYDGPQPSDLCDLLEGEQFFAGFERGLDISTDSPDCVSGRLCFVFYSSLKNLKEVYICPVQGQTGPVRGQVSFYRGDIPSNLPEEVAKKRKGLDSQWLATLPLRLPALNSDNSFILDEQQYPPLNLGDPESGYLTEANLLSISLQIGQDWRVIGINLGLSYQELERIEYKHSKNLGALVLHMLFHWAHRQKSAGPGAVSRLTAAMIESGRRDLAEEIEDIVNIGRRKYSESLRRVGLEAEELLEITSAANTN
ncbi:p53-induced death domain-containing protein 1 isoform X1 [Oryzias latipes]|uniref:P53-induced death domain protein 1 n=1 Tax=Oryzias latipes TaxID=8090 RepID=H2LPC6_ORYLA|nr:p53-induced death domain-containing protein 1 isoform X1 [Oryzias latipes]